MDRENARQEIRRQWRLLITSMTSTAKQRVNGEASYICPLCGHGFHGDGLTWNPKGKEGSLKCFGCNFSGDIIDLYQQAHSADYNTALNDLAGQLGISIDPYRPDDCWATSGAAAQNFAEASQRPVERPQTDETAQGDINTPFDDKTPQNGAQDVTEPVKDYSEYYKECWARLTDPAAVSYLTARGISIDTAAAYYCGYDPVWKSPTALERGKNPPESPRIIIPTTTAHYIARDTRAGLTEAQERFKKMNEGKPGIFNRRALYAQDAQEVFVTEGAFDALSVIEAGAAAIALSSTSNADALIKQLEQHRTAATLILCLDNDNAGRKATQTIRAGLQRLNISFITANISGQYNDPNEHLQRDKAGFIDAIQQAQQQSAAKPDNVKYYIDTLMAGDIERFKKDIKTGYVNLDVQSGGLYEGLYCIAAISSLGKTTFAAQMADQIAAGGHDVLFFSLEQSRLEHVSKSLARITAQHNLETAVTSLSIRRGCLPQNVQEAAEEYKTAVGDRESVIEGNFSCNISFIGDYIRQYIRRNNCTPVIFIDYLQVLQPEQDEHGRRQSTKETVDSTITELKRLSRENGLTIFVISSVNRSNYLTPIDFESLKESGSIEFTCDVIWGLQLQCLNEPLFGKGENLKEKRQRIKEAKAENPRKIELQCLKNRYGIANFTCEFKYYPANDLFLLDDDFMPFIPLKTDGSSGGNRR